MTKQIQLAKIPVKWFKIIKKWIQINRIKTHFFESVSHKNNKIKILKTHNGNYNFSGNDFTNKKNTVGVIYVVRDPRNLITALSHHYELTLDEAFSFLTNERKIIFPINIENNKKNIKEIDKRNVLIIYKFIW